MSSYRTKGPHDNSPDNWNATHALIVVAGSDDFESALHESGRPELGLATEPPQSRPNGFG